ncbi:velvet factor-domain-containing protein [Achaetomium macrosporum]|uniref:Velvet factor-domain-containing protein n=1 Tax=Achaetomium macrosporum TaxID=79813 RepID=A0AAN7HDZ1_9PEZI|nr:velvet factor-domain-containing protein [Achaetomium macrosporum]
MGAPILASAAHAIPALEPAGHSLDAASIISRDTKGGRRLWYCLKVIQQPERARACGSGPKSSADRRPVDPPPVVELRIYEGQTWEMAQEKDITFVYNANFFLFATLEHARIMAHARGTPAANTPPVLTGMPVSGMAYLDRPQEAGYFLFPDLSVRHEGRYKLTFNLYEETKEDKDKDQEREDETQPPIPGLNPATGGSFDFRMEVKSQEFIVYSAKKFPGLAESTALSRDVRMRRRDGKGTGDYDNAEDEYSRRRRTVTPDTRTDYNRARSMSGSTERTPYSAADSQRRPSIADYTSGYSQNPPPGGHLQFLGGNASSQYPAAPPPSFAQPPSVPASPVYPPSQAAPYPMQSFPPPPPPPTAKSHSRERTPSQPGYPPINPAPPRRDSVQHDYRPQLPPPSLPAHRPPTPQQRQMPPLKTQLAPLHIDNSIPSVARLPMPSPTTLATVPRPLAPLSSSSKGPVHPASLPPPTQYAGTKRAHDQTFRQEEEQPRFQDGAREKGLSEDIRDHEQLLLFKRADGTIRDSSHLPF